MNLLFKNPGFQHSIDSIMLFQTEDTMPFWSEPLIYFYPQIEKEKLNSCTPDERKKYLTDVLSKVWEDLVTEIDTKVQMYNTHFLKHKGQIEDALSEAFEVDARSLFNDLVANISLNPVCPRFLKERYFDIFYKNTESGALGISIHEIIHYFWFHVWNVNFRDSYDEYDTPSLKWILSEMVVECIMQDERLSSINPYFPRENGGCVYPYFQDMRVENKLILDTLAQMYKDHQIMDFMKISYEYCLKNEAMIRAHIEEAEKSF